jgi:MoaA/NifB/PqqE/SkfB family radical SAM enzyme
MHYNGAILFYNGESMRIDQKIAIIMQKNKYTTNILNTIKPWYNEIKNSHLITKYGLLYLYKFPTLHKFLYPPKIYIFLTTKCNLRCFICSRTYAKMIGDDIDFKNLIKLNNAIKYAKIIDLTGWGEVTTYPKFKEALKYIYLINPNKNLIDIITNGTLLSKETALLLNGHLHSLVISLNAATEETYNRDMKNGNFIKTIDNIKIFMSALNDSEKDKINLHFVAHTENFKEIPKFIELAHNLKIPSVTIGQYFVNYENHKKFTLLNVKQEYNDIILKSNEKAKELNIFFSAQTFSNSDQTIKTYKPMNCLSPFNECFILPNGDVGVCCYSGGVENMGNAYTTDFESIWFGERYHKLRKHRFLEACKRCIPTVSFDDPNAHFTEYLKQIKT